MLSEKAMRSVGAAVVKRLDFLFLLLFLCTLSALRLEFIVCNVGKRCICDGGFAFDRYQPQIFVQNPYKGVSYVSRILTSPNHDTNNSHRHVTQKNYLITRS